MKSPKPKPDRQDCIYTSTGGFSHDILERFYSQEISYEDMVKEFDTAWLTYELAELKFDRNNPTKDKNVRDKYHDDLIHFFNHHNVITKKILLESFITIKIKNEYFQGYIDALIKDDEGNYIIIDWKTSSIYKGNKAIKESGQLLLYAIGLHQRGIPYEKIKICWNFLKYVNVSITQKNGNTKIRQIERSKLGESLVSNAKMWLKHFEYDDDLLEYLDLLIETNDILCLPKEIQDKYIFEDCYIYVNITNDLIKSIEKQLITTLIEIRKKEKEFIETHNDKVFWDDLEDVKRQSFYYSTLCEYSPRLMLPYASYLESLNEKQAKKLDKSFKICNKPAVGKEAIDDDLSWLEEI